MMFFPSDSQKENKLPYTIKYAKSLQINLLHIFDTLKRKLELATRGTEETNKVLPFTLYTIT